MYVAVSEAIVGVGDLPVMASPDGTNWSLCTAVPYGVWSGVAYGGNGYVAVAPTPTGTTLDMSGVKV